MANALQLTIKTSTVTFVFRFTLTLETTLRQMVKNGSSANAASSGSTLSVKSKMGTQIFLNFFVKIILKAFSTFVLVAERKRVKFLLRARISRRNLRIRTLQSRTQSLMTNKT